jgi:hypothetical protein
MVFYPVGSCLIIAAHNIDEARIIALNTVIHTKEITISEINIDEPKVIIYLSGDY